MLKLVGRGGTLKKQPDARQVSSINIRSPGSTLCFKMSSETNVSRKDHELNLEVASRCRETHPELITRPGLHLHLYERLN